MESELRQASFLLIVADLWQILASRFFCINSVGGWGPWFELLGSKVSAKSIDRQGNDNQGDAKGRQLEPKGTQSEPTGGQNASKHHCLFWNTFKEVRDIPF